MMGKWTVPALWLKIIPTVSPSAEENINTSVIQIGQLRPQNYASYCVMEARCGDTPLQCQNTGESAVDGHFCLQGRCEAWSTQDPVCKTKIEKKKNRTKNESVPWVL